jgi:hypothetical protein
MVLLLSPITYKSCLRVLCPVRRPTATLDCVLLKDNNGALAAKSGLEINSRALLWVLQGPHHITKCWLSIQGFIFLLLFCLETPEKGSGPTNFWTQQSLARLSVISFPRTLACPGTQYSPILIEDFFFHLTEYGLVNTLHQQQSVKSSYNINSQEIRYEKLRKLHRNKPTQLQI